MKIYEDYRDNVNKFEAVYKKLCKPFRNKDKNNLTSLYFFSIAMAIQKKYALHLISYLCFLKEMNSYNTPSFPKKIKMTTDFKSIDDYIAQQPERNIPILEKIRQTIKEVVPDAEETISYQMPAYKYFGTLVYFAGFKNHIGFYALPSGNAAFQKELTHYKMGKGSIQFTLDKPIPYDLIRKIVQFRVEENKLKMNKAK